MRKVIPGVFAALLILAACELAPDAERATTRFVECLERNGVVAEDVSVTLAGDGTIEGISAVIVEEGDVPYEPTVRLACTEEVENAL
jgi:hypothetical protein